MFGMRAQVEVMKLNIEPPPPSNCVWTYSYFSMERFCLGLFDVTFLIIRLAAQNRETIKTLVAPHPGAVLPLMGLL